MSPFYAMRGFLVVVLMTLAGCSSSVPATPSPAERATDFAGANVVLVAEAAAGMDAVAAALTADGWFIAQQSAQSLSTDWRSLSSSRVRLSVARLPDGRLVVRGERANRGTDETSAQPVESRGPRSPIVQDADRERTLHGAAIETWDALVGAARRLGTGVAFARW